MPLESRRFALLALALTIGICGCDRESMQASDAKFDTFKAEDSLSRQLELADELVPTIQTKDLPALAPWLTHKDRRVRGNTAYIFAKLGEPRGLRTIFAILNDFSSDRIVHAEDFTFSQIIPWRESEAEARQRWDKYVRSPWAIQTQTTADRYYAVHLLGLLRDPAAVDVLIPMLRDRDVWHKVAWALGEIGDRRAVSALIKALSNQDALLRVSSIGALEKLRAVGAIGELQRLTSDTEVPRAGDQVPVGETARKALTSLQATSDVAER